MPGPALSTVPEMPAAAQPPLLGELIAQHAADQPDKIALVSRDGSTRYADFTRLADRVAHLARLTKVGPPVRVAIRIRRKRGFLEAVFAAMLAGATVVPIDADTAEEQMTLLKETEPALVIHDESLDVDRSAFSRTRFASLDEVEATALPAGRPPAAGPDRQAIALILYTSGTERFRKGVMLSHGNIAANTHYINAFMKLGGEAVEFVMAPVNHAFGFGRCRCVLAAGGTLVLDDRPFNPLAVIGQIRKHGCNALSSVSTGIALFLENLEKQFSAVASQMRWIEIGSLPLRHALA